MKKIPKSYHIGLDIGTNSVGWAVVDDNFKLITKGNQRKNMWGVRLFDTASTAEERRTFRSTRRRYERRKKRIEYLQEIFNDEIVKVDNTFYQKLKDSFYTEKDPNRKKVTLTDFDKLNIFGNNNRKIENKKYETIYHIRNKIINSKEKEDIRLIYLAIHHIIKYRGNFLYNNDNFNVNNLDIQSKLKDLFEEIYVNCKKLDFDIDSLDEKLYNELEIAITESSINDKKILIKNALKNNFNNEFIKEFTNLIIGNTFNVSKLLNIDLENTIKLSFKETTYDDKYDEIANKLKDKISVLELFKELYDILFLKNLFENSKETNISSLMIEKYNKHHKDLVDLKKILKYDKSIYKLFFKDQNKNTSKEKLCLYSQYINNKISYKDFTNKIDKEVKQNILNKILPTELKEKYDNLIKDIEQGTFMPRITSTDNGKYPYQLNKDELIKIIESQGKYYNFLCDKITINGKEKYKLVQLLEFKIPYYVGPLNKNTNTKNVNNKNAWLIKKDNVSITPFNFDEIIDKEKTAEEFILRMISNCTYLLNEKAMPNNSILYSKYKVLNELKQIKVNNDKIPNTLQHKIYEELFLKTSDTITEKKFISYLKTTNKYSMYADIEVKGYSDNKKFANNMKSYIDFFGDTGIFKNTNYSIDDAEEIIKWVTIFEDKDILETKVRKNYSLLSEEQIKQILVKKYKGWSNLSKKLLTGVTYQNEDNINKSIMDLLWETNENFMQIMFNNKYKFQDKINELNIADNTSKINYSLVENLVTSPSTKRGIYQALKVVEEIVDYIGYNPSNIVIEMAKGDETKQRKDDKLTKLKNAYNKHKDNIDNYNYLYAELNKLKVIDKEKLFLYFIQLGKSMYSGEPLDINNLNSYEVDHIIPRTLIKDNSIDNKVLVLKEENQEKNSNFILPEHFRKEMINWWSYLKDLELISIKKYNNLTRNYYSEKDIEGFINRQLVETRQISKHIANILNSFYKNTNIIYLHANLGSNYREKYELFKYRDLNDFHHAHDAYIACVLGLYQKYYMKKTTDFSKLREMNRKMYQNNKYNDLKYGYVINSIDNEVSTFNETTGEIKFDADYFNNTVKTTLYKNNVIISRKTEVKTDRFYKETIFKKDDIRSKFSIKENMPTNLYGGYNETNYSYMKLIEYKKNKKVINAFIGIPILLENSQNKDEAIDEYIKKSYKIDEYKVKKDKVPFNTLIKYKNQYFVITGCGVSQAELANATEFSMPKEYQIKYKYLLNYIFNNKYPNKDIYSSKNNLADMSNEEFKLYCKEKFNDEINDLFNYIINYMKDNYPVYNGITEKLLLIKQNKKFDELQLEISEEDKENISKIYVIKELFKMLKCNSTNANLEKLKITSNDKLFGNRVGRQSGVNVSTGTIINKSVTGLKENKYEF